MVGRYVKRIAFYRRDRCGEEKRGRFDDGMKVKKRKNTEGFMNSFEVL